MAWIILTNLSTLESCDGFDALFVATFLASTAGRVFRHKARGIRMVVTATSHMAMAVVGVGVAAASSVLVIAVLMVVVLEGYVLVGVVLMAVVVVAVVMFVG